MFETEQDVLTWYERQPRTVDEHFARNVPWQEVADYELDPKLIPILLYMRDVEHLTDRWYKELLHTPTGRDPVIRKFLDRWSGEENDHAELLNRFLNEAGVPTIEQWQNEAKSKIPFGYRVSSFAITVAVNPLGRYFAGTHMVWGAINEMTTLQGYRRLWKLANHPVLEKVLRGIAREEAVHAKFYWSIAKLKLERSEFSRKLARSVVARFWAPVGQGAKPQEETEYLISTLFRGAEGFEFFDRNVNRRVKDLPGFDAFDNIAQRVAPIVA